MNSQLKLFYYYMYRELGWYRRNKQLLERGDKFAKSEDFITGHFISFRNSCVVMRDLLEASNIKTFNIQTTEDKRFLCYRNVAVEIKVDNYGMTEYIEFNNATWCSHSYDDMVDWLDYQINDWLVQISDEEFENYFDKIFDEN